MKTLDFILLHLRLQDFCFDMPDGGLRKGQNMWQTCKGII